jgi:hypothetical protein
MQALIGMITNPHLLIQRVQHALPCPVAVALVWQQHDARWAAMALERVEEALRLQREGACVVVLLQEVSAQQQMCEGGACSRPSAKQKALRCRGLASSAGVLRDAST